MSGITVGVQPDRAGVPASRASRPSSGLTTVRRGASPRRHVPSRRDRDVFARNQPRPRRYAEIVQLRWKQRLGPVQSATGSRCPPRPSTRSWSDAGFPTASRRTTGSASSTSRWTTQPRRPGRTGLFPVDVNPAATGPRRPAAAATSTPTRAGHRAVACMGDGILLDISDGCTCGHEQVRDDTNFAFWHSATFNTRHQVVYTDELGGGGAPPASTPSARPAAPTGSTTSSMASWRSPYHEMPRTRSDTEYCVADKVAAEHRDLPGDLARLVTSPFPAASRMTWTSDRHRRRDRAECSRPRRDDPLGREAPVGTTRDRALVGGARCAGVVDAAMLPSTSLRGRSGREASGHQTVRGGDREAWVAERQGRRRSMQLPRDRLRRPVVDRCVASACGVLPR